MDSIFPANNGGAKNETSNSSSEKSSGNSITIPQIALPKGGGAIKSIDEKFQVNAANGTAGFSIPFPFSPSRNSFMPGMALSYNSGSGNGNFGLGWNADPPSITRKTDRKLPEYNDAEESDTFIFSGAEDLVPALKKVNDNWIKDESPDGSVKNYRPRIEGGFARIEKITETGGNVYWKVTSRDNVISIFGKSKSAQIFNPNNETKIFKWLLEFSCDDKGNCFQFEYKKDDKTNVPNQLYEKNRLNDFSKCTNAYLKKIKYCNKNHFKRDGLNFTDWGNFLNNIDYLLELVLDYGEHDLTNPQPNDDSGWTCREDAFSEYRSGFEIRTYRLCQRVLMFHHFPELGDQPCLVRSMNFKYDTGASFTFLKLITQTGFIRKVDGTYSEKSLPPIEFSYEQLGWNTEVKSLPKESLENLPTGIDDQSYQWIDLYGEGISGILTEQANGWYYKSNSGGGKFDSVKLVSPKPSFNGLSMGAAHFQDIEANGQKHLVSNELNGYYEFTPADEWLPFKTFLEVPNIDLRDTKLKFLDLNGDGKADILISEDDVFVWYASKGKEGFESYQTTRKIFDEEKGPAIVFTDSTQSIVLADMSGDGLMDIVRIRNKDIVYWPNLGYGKFGAKVSMSNAPMFDNPDHFNSKYVKLADLDGSGITGIVYLGKDSFKIYFNQSGNSWSEENIVHGINPLPFPKMDDHANVNIIDLLGNGTGCIVWSSPLPAHASNPLRYIDLMNGKKPHIMTSYKNNMGKETFIEYKPSTFFYLKDKADGKPWITKLPFPVQCVSSTTVEEKWRQTKFSNQYLYHHGYYDYADREFRGFGRVDQVDIESFGEFAAGNIYSPYITEDKLLYQPPVMTKTWFHTGAFLDNEKILSQFAHEYFSPVSTSFSENKLPEPDLNALDLNVAEYKEALRSCKGMTLRQEVYELDVDELDIDDPEHKKYLPVKLFTAAFHNCNIQLQQPKMENLYAVFLTTESEAITYNYEVDLSNPDILPDPRIAHTLNLQTDEFGNVLQAIAVVYPRIGKHLDPTLPAGAEQLIESIQQESHLSYTVNTFTDDVLNEIDYRLRLPCEVQNYELTGLSPSSGFYFSLKELRNITAAEISEIPYHTLPNNTSVQKRMVECVRILYFNEALNNPENPGVINALAIPYETYKLALTNDLLNAILREKLLSLQNAGESYEAMLARVLKEGGYHLEDSQWWIRSGIAGFADDAAEHFYLPEKYTDPFDNETNLQFDDYDLYIKSSDDPVGNHTEVSVFDFRVMAPSKMKDMNNNESEVIFDILGAFAAMAVKGKGNEGDNLIGINTEIDRDSLIDLFTNEVYYEAQAQAFLGNATARYVYYLGEAISADGNITYGNHPACAAGITREKHAAQLSSDEVSPIQIAFQYSDGSGTVIAVKVQAENDIDGNVKWITNGKTILNNKGKAVKQYQPYFTATHVFEEPFEVGVTPIMYYDAAGRLIRSEAPDGSYSRVEVTPWFSKVFDQNDTVNEEGNKWYQDNSNSEDPAKKVAVSQTLIHANTPAQIFFDSLSRTVISIAHNRGKRGNPLEGETVFEEKYLTYTKLDSEGKPLWIQDPRGNRVMQYIFPYKPDGVAEETWNENYSPCYDIAGNLLFQHSMDAGDRWMITDAAGKPLYSWDINEKQLPNNNFITENRMYYAEYDGLHRPKALWLTINDSPKALIDKTIYGDDKAIPAELVPDPQVVNLRGQAYQHYDSGGAITNTQFDFKGNLLEAQKQIAASIKESVIDWQDNSETSGVEPETFSQQTEYDALNRMTRLYNWHKSDTNVAVYEPQYSKRGILEGENIIVKASITNGGYVGGQTTIAISNIIYDAKGQLQHIYYGNGTVTRYIYDQYTLRLQQLRTTRKDFDADLPVAKGFKDPRVLQNLYFTHDAVGNITEIYDDAFETAFFNNQMVEPRSLYKYDALYQLIEARGRENSALNSAPERQGIKAYETSLPVSGQLLRNYLQEYFYDATGNILQMKHRAGNDNLTDRWTRNYKYDENSNHLLKTWIGNDKINAVEYKYDAHGSMRNLENTVEEQYIRWDYNDMIKWLNCLGGGWAYYQYDNSKQRNRKLIERVDGTREERLYLGGMEWYQRKNANGDIKEEVESHHLFSGSQRLLIVEDVFSTDNSLLSTGILYRYQYSNHLGSVGVEADETGSIISYEEYHPYGTTAYSLQNADIKITAKRYRYTGMERDEETGLNYQHARYLADWLGRWIAADPIYIRGGANLYAYCTNAPIIQKDITGLMGDPELMQEYRNRQRCGKDFCGNFPLPEWMLALFGGIYGAGKVIVSGFIGIGKATYYTTSKLLYEATGSDIWQDQAETYDKGIETLHKAIEIGPGELLKSYVKVTGERFMEAINKGDAFGAADVFGETLMNLALIADSGSAITSGSGGAPAMVTSTGEIIAGTAAATAARASLGIMLMAGNAVDSAFRKEPKKEKDPNTKEAKAASAALRKKFMDVQLKKILADENHPLRFLIDEKTGNWKSRSAFSQDPTVQAGHLISRHSGEPEFFALEDSFFNQLSNWKGETQGVIFGKGAVEIGGVPVELRTAYGWEQAGELPVGTVDKAVRSGGWRPAR